MSRRLFSAILLSTFALCGTARAEESAPKHLELAREFLANTKPENNEHYAQGVRSLLRPSDKGSSGEYIVKTDCIGFIESLLKMAYGKDMPKPQTKKFERRYSIIDYVDSVGSGQLYTKLTRIDELRPGDVVMWKYADGYTRKVQANGHALMLDGTPKRVCNKFFSKSWSLTQYQVKIIDSSDFPKSDDDTRLKIGPKQTGVGSGTFNLYADDDGVVKAVSFDFAKSDLKYQDKDYIIVMARPI